MYLAREQGQQASGGMSMEMHRILEFGNSIGWSQYLWVLVDGLKQPYHVVARQMTVGEIAHGLIFLEFRDAATRHAQESNK